MSVVTNVILHMGLLTESEVHQTMEEVNAFFSNEQRGFVHVDDEGLPDGWYGGSKMLEADLAIGAFNHLDLDALIHHLQSLKWDIPEDIQVIVKGQNDDRFRIIDLFPEK